MIPICGAGDIRLRPAIMSDARRLFDWQQHPATRRHFRDPRPPAWDDHVRWLAGRLADPGCQFAIIHAEGRAAGTLRLERRPADGEGVAWEISILVAPDRHGRGIGRAALARAAALAGDAAINAEVLPDNAASRALFAGVGYRERAPGKFVLPGAAVTAPAGVLLCPDGGTGIGLGHVTRAAAVASALHRRGIAPAVAADDHDGLAGALRQRGLEPAFVAAEATALAELAQRERYGVVVLDHRRLDAAEVRRVLPPEIRLVCFDDSPEPDAPADVVINGSPALSSLVDMGSDARLMLLGPSYQPVRADVPRGDPARRARPPRRVLVTVGGEDPGGLLRALTAWIETRATQRWPALRFDVVIGPFAPPVQARSGAVEVHRAPASLCPLMQSADIAISAAGQTLFELSVAAVPTIALSVGADQGINLRAMIDHGSTIGLAGPGAAGWQERLENALGRLVEDAASRVDLATRAITVFDGNGADRIAGVLSLMARLQTARGPAGP